MDIKRFEEITGRILSDERDCIIKLSIKQAWLLISVIQLATRHPELSDPLKNAIKSIAEQLQEPILSLHPDSIGLINLGWNPDYDTPIEDDITDYFGEFDYRGPFDYLT